jgi:hypothetical protein
MAGVFLYLIPAAFSQGVTGNGQGEPARDSQIEQIQAQTAPTEIHGTVKVTVDMAKVIAPMAPRALGMEVSVTDNDLITVEVLTMLRNDGITTLRFPGGAYADDYHWATHKTTTSDAAITQRFNNISPRDNFGHFVALIDRVGTAVITVNYGSNQDGTGGGEPAEAAAWVAYANGDPSNTKAIGKDSTGYDWQTVGYWASLRASKPLPVDDGKNFLRINHPPLNIKYWEVGNEVYNNGYYGGNGSEVDFHAPYPKDLQDNVKDRNKNSKLSPDAYGAALVQFAKAMKAVDPNIKVGASLGSPVESEVSENWKQDINGQWVDQGMSKAFDAGVDWDNGVLKAAGRDIDFVALQWHPSDTTKESGYKDMDNAKLLSAPQDHLPKMLAGLLGLLQKYCGDNLHNMQLLVTGLGPEPFVNVTNELVPGLFAADAYMDLINSAAANIDWTELRKGAFVDEKNKPGSVYFGLQMIHHLMNFNEPVVQATSSNSLLNVHAAKHNDGSLSIMFINDDPKHDAKVKVNVDGGGLGKTGKRFDFGQSNPPNGNVIQDTPIDNLGTSFTITVPAYTISDIVIPKA